MSAKRLVMSAKEKDKKNIQEQLEDLKIKKKALKKIVDEINKINNTTKSK